MVNISENLLNVYILKFFFHFFANLQYLWDTKNKLNVRFKTMFNFIKEKLYKVYTGITSQLQSIFAQSTIDQATISQIHELLIKADTGVATTKNIITKLNQSYAQGKLQHGSDLQDFLKNELIELLALPKEQTTASAQVFLLVGINGSGKTTFAGKLAHYFKNQNKSCLIAAADTFRAAAPEQLTVWAKQAQAELIIGKHQEDPASVVFDACKQFAQNQHDILIIDTAGRLQTKEFLMKELEKIKRIITKQLPNHTICTLLTIDAMLGQNSLEQARIFHQAANVNGIILTKMDGSAKGGIVFSITQELHIPIAFLSWGEHIDDLMLFDAQLYVQNLLGLSQFQSNK